MHHLNEYLQPAKTRGQGKGEHEARKSGIRADREDRERGSMKPDDQSCSSAVNNLRVIYLTGIRAAKNPISRTVKKT